MRGSYELPRVWSVSSSRSSLLHDCCWEESLRLKWCAWLNGGGGEREGIKRQARRVVRGRRREGGKGTAGKREEEGEEGGRRKEGGGSSGGCVQCTEEVLVH